MAVKVIIHTATRRVHIQTTDPSPVAPAGHEVFDYGENPVPNFAWGPGTASEWGWKIDLAGVATACTEDECDQAGQHDARFLQRRQQARADMVAALDALPAGFQAMVTALNNLAAASTNAEVIAATKAWGAVEQTSFLPVLRDFFVAYRKLTR